MDFLCLLPKFMRPLALQKRGDIGVCCHDICKVKQGSETG